MTMNRSDIRTWLDGLDYEDVAVDEGGLTLVELDTNGEATGEYLEIGGY